MQKTYKYKAFISYSHKDKEFARWVHQSIENYKIPKSLREKYPHLPKNLKRSIFLDEEELPTSPVLSDNITDSLEKSKLLIVICSPNSVRSLWVNKEIVTFKQMRGEKSVLAIIKDGEPKASKSFEYDDSNEAFPKALRYEVDSEGNLLAQKPTEPLAGDTREGHDKKKALMKMIAGVLDVHFADLWEREKREERKRKVFWFVVLASFVALVFYASTQFVGESTTTELERIDKEIITIEYKIKNEEFSTPKLIELNDKLKQLKQDKINVEDISKWFGKYKTPFLEKVQKVAQEEKVGTQKAIKLLTSVEAKANREKRNKDSSKELVALAKFYVKEYQFQEANSSYAEAIDEFFDYDNVKEYANFLYKQNQLKRAIELYEKLLTHKLLKEQKATILNHLGNLYNKINRVKEAEKVYVEALVLDRALAKNNPSRYNFTVGKTLNHLGNLYNKVNRVEEAEKAYDEALELNRALAKKNSSVYNSTVAGTLHNLGRLYDKVNRVEEAEKAYVEALVLNRVLAKNNPSVYNYYVATTLNNFGNLYAKVNRVKEAEKAYAEALELRRALAKKNPSAYNYDVAKTLNNLGNLHNKVNQVKEAEKAYLEALELFRALAKNNPLAYNYYLSTTLINLGVLYKELNRVKEAEKAYVEALELRRALAKKNPSVYNADVAMTLTTLANLYDKINRVEEAEKAYVEALELYRRLAKKNPLEYNSDVAMTLTTLANLYDKIKRVREAEKAYLEALELYRALSKKNPLAYNAGVAMTLYNLGILHNKLKRVREAEKVYVEALELYRALAKNNPSVYNFDVAMTLHNLGILYNKLKRVREAEKAYVEALELRRALAKNNPSVYNSDVAMTLNQLGLLFNKVKQVKEAEKAFVEALKLRRALAKKNPSAYNYYVVSTLNNLGNHYYMQLINLDKAREYYMESLKLDHNQSLVFTNLYELQIITNQDITNVFEVNYINVFSTKKEQFIQYEMLKIIKDISQNKKVDLILWQEKYNDVSLGGWSFIELDEWIKTLKDKAIKKKINKALSIFKAHNKPKKQ